MTPRDTPGQQREGHHVELKVPFEGDAPRDLRVTAYAFDRRGQLIASGMVEGGQARLPLTAEQAREARIVVGPPLPDGEGAERATPALMQKLHAYEPVWRFDPAQSVQELLPIPEALWKLWSWCRCRIRGRVVRRVSVAGIPQDLPVCHARVHVCQIDPLPWLIRELSDELVIRLRDDLFRELERPVRRPGPIPDPAPLAIDPAQLDPSVENIARVDGRRTRAAWSRTSRSIDAVALNPQPLPPRISSFVSRAEIVGFNPQPDPPGGPVLVSLPVSSRVALMSTAVGEIRQALLAHVDLVRSYVCLWPWFWWYFRCDEIAVLETDAQGRFDTTHWYLCAGDRPDVYFWVEVFLGGVWTTVYRPLIACSTYWDYACGSAVTIRLTDPRVPACGDPGDSVGKSVTVMGIGENVSSHEIQMASAASQGLTSAGEPFGGVLEPRVQFGRAALFAAGITHYRWSYRRLTLADGVATASDPDWHHLSRQVGRHYELPSGVLGIGPSFPSEPLGPDPAFPGHDVFKIQPMAPSAPGNDGWAIVDSHEDNATAFFETQLLNVADPDAVAGRYELALELFRTTGGVPVLVNLTDEGVALFIPDQDAPFGSGTVTTTAPASSEYYVLDAAMKRVAFRLVVRVDNNVCHGNVIDVTVGGAGAGPCGFIEYTGGAAASAQVSFMASHPHDFATFAFNVYRGSSGSVLAAGASGGVGDAGANGFVRSGSVFAKTLFVADLLTGPTDPPAPPGPACTKGAFAESLRVEALATDGWYRLSALDGPRGGPSEIATKAFAVEPAVP